MKKYQIIFILLIFIINIGCSKKNESINSEKDNKEKNRRLVKTMEIEPKTLNEYSHVVGITQPDKRIKLSSFSGGLIEKLYFEEGDFVNEGDTLAEIDLELQLIKLNKFLAEFENIKAEFQKDKTLYNKKTISKLKYIKSKSRYESMLRDIDQIKLYIERAVIKAPVSGYIVSKPVEENEIIPPGHIVYVLNKMDILKIKFELPEKDIQYFKENKTELNIIFDAYPEDEIKSTITRIANEVNYKNLTFEAETEINNKDYKYKAGLLARIKILKQKIDNTIFVPQDAVLDFQTGSKVAVLNGDTVSLVQVKTGATEDDNIQILEGLTAGDRIVIQGQNDIFDGDKVKVVK